MIQSICAKKKFNFSRRNIINCVVFRLKISHYFVHFRRRPSENRVLALPLALPQLYRRSLALGRGESWRGWSRRGRVPGSDVFPDQEPVDGVHDRLLRFLGNRRGGRGGVFGVTYQSYIGEGVAPSRPPAVATQQHLRAPEEFQFVVAHRLLQGFADFGLDSRKQVSPDRRSVIGSLSRWQRSGSSRRYRNETGVARWKLIVVARQVVWNVLSCI